MTLNQHTYDELDREHEQARVALQNALICGDERTYRLADRFEERVRAEKYRRARDRDGPSRREDNPEDSP